MTSAVKIGEAWQMSLYYCVPKESCSQGISLWAEKTLWLGVTLGYMVEGNMKENK